MKPVTLYRNPLWRGDNPLQGAEAVEWRALPASDFDALVREREATREALRETIDASAACLRVIHKYAPFVLHEDIVAALEVELRDAKVENGFGVRAKAALTALREALAAGGR